MAGLDILYFCAALGALFYSGGVMVRSLTRIGQYMRLSEYALSFVLAAFATSLPELFIGITSSLHGVPALSLGNIVGASFFNITAVLGIVILFAGKLGAERSIKGGDMQITFGMIVFPALLILDGVLSRTDGLLLLFFFGGYLVYLMDHEHESVPADNPDSSGNAKPVGNFLMPSENAFLPGKLSYRGIGDAVVRAELSFKNFIKELGEFLLIAVLLGVSANLVVDNGIIFGRDLGLPLFFIGIMTAFGTTLPEAVFGVRSAISHHGSMSLGNALGSIIVNTSLVLGLVSVIDPIEIVNPLRAVFGLLFTALMVLLVEGVGFLRGSFGRFFGFFLLGVAAAFVLIEAGL